MLLASADPDAGAPEPLDAVVVLEHAASRTAVAPTATNCAAERTRAFRAPPGNGLFIEPP
jgi:hypothetical protein